MGCTHTHTHTHTHGLFCACFTPGGGATLDVGIYPIAMASLIFGGGRPESIKATGYLTDTGVDELASIIIKYPGKIVVFFYPLYVTEYLN